MAASGNSTHTVIAFFASSPSDGAVPRAGLIADANGDLFGTTAGGGTNSDGTVFELVKDTTSLTGYTEKVIASFTGSPSDGAAPEADLIADANGDLFGTTTFGGTNGAGTVFELVKDAASSTGYTEKVIAFFTGSPSDGAILQGGLIADANGDLFGTTQNGGSNNIGTAFELVKDAASPTGYTEKVIASFTGSPSDGAGPDASLIADANGNLFGTTQSGGTNNDGTVFELVKNVASPTGYTKKVIASFTGTNGDGVGPRASLIADANGNLFGTTQNGGTKGDGTVFELVKDAASPTGYTEKVIASFTGTNGDGATPEAGLIADANGDLFGTTAGGGTNDEGTAFEILNSGFLARSNPTPSNQGSSSGPSTTPTPGPDNLTGTAGDDTIAALAGDDTINGVAGNDLLFGNQGNDFITDGDGNSTVAGGMDNDRITVGNGSNLLYGDEGADTITAGNGNNTILGGTGNAMLDVNDGADLITVGSGNNLVLGNQGNDTIALGGGSDTAFGGMGNDLITATGSGSDLLYGNEGSDTIQAGNGDNTIVGGSGNSAIDSVDGADLITSGSGNDLIFGNGGDDTVAAGGGADTVLGGYGNDIILGNQGDDIILGNQGDDTLVGGMGNDTLVGGQGNDVLYGNQGDDVLYGNEGSNTFVFNPGDTDFKSGLSTGDVVMDFGTGKDRLDFASGPAGTAANFGATSTTAKDFASAQALAQTLINGGDAYAFVANGTDGYLFTTGGSGTAIQDAVKLAGAGTVASLTYRDIAPNPIA